MSALTYGACMELFVAGFPLDLDEKKLASFFDIHGFKIQSIKIMREKSTGFSKGFGFVTMRTKDEADKVMSKLNGQFFEGWKMTVKEARNKSQKLTHILESGKKNPLVKGSYRGPKQLQILEGRRSLKNL